MINKIFNYTTILTGLGVSLCSIFIYPEVIFLIFVVALSVKLYSDRLSGKKNIITMEEATELARNMSPKIFPSLSANYISNFPNDNDWRALSKPQQELIISIIANIFMDRDFPAHLAYSIFAKSADNKGLRFVACDWKSTFPSKKWEELTNNEKSFWYNFINSVKCL